MEMPIPYLEGCLIFINLVFLWETYLDWRQHQKYKINEQPIRLKAIVSPEKFREAQAYGLAKSNFGLFESIISHVVSIGFLWYGILPWTWDLAVQVAAYFSSDSEIFQSMFFVAIQSLFWFVFGMPFSIYRTFVIEEQFGFNKTTVATFVSDIIKSIALSVVIGAPLIAAFISIIQWGGRHFYFYLWVFVMAFQLVMITIFPTLIQPLFNKVEELEQGELRTKIEALATKTGFPLTALYKIDGSKRSGHSNAYFYGFFKNKRIVLYDTLIEQSSQEEVVAVLGHELGHYFLNHTIMNIGIIAVYLFITFYLFGEVMHNTQLYHSFGFQTKPVMIGFTLFQQVFNPIDHVISFLMNALSRYNEFQADAFSVKLGHGTSLASGLIKLQTENLSTMIPDEWYSTYHHSHPPLVERLQAIEKVTTKKE